MRYAPATGTEIAQGTTSTQPPNPTDACPIATVKTEGLASNLPQTFAIAEWGTLGAAVNTGTPAIRTHARWFPGAVGLQKLTHSKLQSLL
jgi:hypothetical protein